MDINPLDIAQSFSLMDNNTIIIATSLGVIGITTAIVLYTRSMGGRTSKVTASSSTGPVPVAGKVPPKEAVNKYPAGKLDVYFGSQTGTAEGFARIIVEEAKRRGFDAKSIDLEDFNADSLADSTLNVFLMATYGEGEPTDNSQTFYKWLKDSDNISPGFLSNVKYCVFGLGNKQYEHFNRMGKFVDENLEIHGGQRIVDLGLGDDDGTLEDDFEKWRDSLWPVLAPAGGAAQKIQTDDREVELVFEVVEHKATTTKSQNTIHSLSKPLFSTAPAKVSVIRELRSTSSSESGSTLHVEIDLSESQLTYKTADNLAIIAENSTSDVTAFAESQGYNLATVYDIKPIEDKASAFKRIIPTPFTVREALTLYLDIKGHVRPAIASQLLHYTSDASQKAWLKELLQRENRDSYKIKIEEARHSIYSLLTGPLNSCKLPLDVLLHIVPVQQPRYYTISSSSSVYPGKPHITVSIAEEVLKNGQPFIGQCSGLLKRFRDGDAESESSVKKIRVFVKESSFRLPPDLSTPVILIGPGTGFAPMRALLQERKHLRTLSKSVYGPTTLYFGCKYSAIDHIYKDEMESFISDGIITSFRVAYSRDSSEKVYVQHLMLQPSNADALWTDIQNNGYIYVCGATGMGSDVHHALVAIAKKKGLTEAAAEALLVKMKESGRYVQELWN